MAHDQKTDHPASSLPPETAGVDWDEDVASARARRSAIPTRRPTVEELEAGDRETAVPDLPMSELNALLLAGTEGRTDPPPSVPPTLPGVGGEPPSGQPTWPTETSRMELSEPGQYSAGPPSGPETYRVNESASSGLVRDQLTLDLDDFGCDSDRTSPTTLRPTDPPQSEAEAATHAVLSRLRRELRDRYAVGDFSGALETAEQLLVYRPDDDDARRYADSCREVLTHMLSARVGGLRRVAKIVVAPDQIRWLSLDHRAGFFLSLVDGVSTAEELLDVSGMTRLEALRILSHLLEHRVIALEPQRERE